MLNLEREAKLECLKSFDFVHEVISPRVEQSVENIKDAARHVLGDKIGGAEGFKSQDLRASVRKLMGALRDCYSIRCKMDFSLAKYMFEWPKSFASLHLKRWESANTS